MLYIKKLTLLILFLLELHFVGVAQNTQPQAPTSSSAGTYTIVYDGNGATDGQMDFKTYSIGQNETTKLEKNEYKKEFKVSFDTQGGNSLPDMKSQCDFTGWLQDEFLTSITNDWESNWTNVYPDLAILSKDDDVNVVEFLTDAYKWERTYSQPVYMPEGDHVLKFSICSPTGYDDLNFSPTQRMKVAVCSTPQTLEDEDQDMLSKGTDTSYVFIKQNVASTQMTEMSIMVYSTGGPAYITFNGGHIRDYLDVTFRVSPFALYINDQTSAIYPDNANTTDLVREETGVITLKAQWECNDSIALPLPEKEGSQFKEWNTQPDGTGVSYAADDSILVISDMTLYALWIPNIYTNLKDSICDGSSYSFGNKQLTIDGTYVDSFPSASGSDSIVTLELTVLSPDTVLLFDTIQTGEPYQKWGFNIDMPTTGKMEFVDSLLNVNGCDSLVHLYLEVEKLTAQQNGPICEGEEIVLTVNGLLPGRKIQWHCPDDRLLDADTLFKIPNAKPTDAGVYTLELVLPDSNVVVGDVTIEVSQKSKMDTTITIQQSEVFVYDSLELTTSGKYTFNRLNSKGCDSIININLEVKELSFTYGGPICEGEDYQITINGLLPNRKIQLTYPNGEKVFVDDEILFENTKPEDSGLYTLELFQDNGNVKLDEVNLIVYPKSETDTTIKIQKGESYSIDSQNLTENGNYSFHFQNIHGCDSIVNLNLLVQELELSQNGPLCEGEDLQLNVTGLLPNRKLQWRCPGNRVLPAEEQFTLPNVTPSDAGNYWLDLVLDSGNVAVGMLPVEIFPKYEFDTTVIIQQGEKFVHDSQEFTTPGKYPFHYKTQNGCDSIVNVILQVQELSISQNSPICENEELTLGVTGLLPDRKIQWRCPDDRILDVDDQNQLRIPSTKRTDAGVYTLELIQADESVKIDDITVVVFPRFESDTMATIQQGETFIFDSQIFTESGEYQFSYKTQNGCDSIVNVNLDVKKVSLSQNGPICEGEELQLNVTGLLPNRRIQWRCPNDRVLETDTQLRMPDATPSDAGEYLLELIQGDSSVVIAAINVVVFPRYEIDTTVTIQKFETYTFDSKEFTEPGDYSFSYKSQNGCDSIVNLHLQAQELLLSQNGPFCEGKDIWLTVDGLLPGRKIQWRCPDGKALKADSLLRIMNATPSNAGVYTLEFMAGNDYITIGDVTVEIYPIQKVDTIIKIQEGESYPFANQQLTRSGHYTYVYQSKDGCDSIVSLDLVVSDLGLTHNGPYCEGEDILMEITGLLPDRKVQLRCPDNHVIEVEKQMKIPNAKPSDSGVYTLEAVHEDGNVKVDEVTIDVFPSYEIDMEITIQEGETYRFNSKKLTAPGQYNAQLKTMNGCDSIVNLQLDVKDLQISYNGPVCEGEDILLDVTGLLPNRKIQWVFPDDHVSDNGNQLHIPHAKPSDSGVYSLELVQENGAVVIEKINVEVFPKYQIDTTITIQKGEFYTFDSKQLTESGQYSFTKTTVNGCDSIENLKLVVKEIELSQNGPLCEGEDIILKAAGMLPNRIFQWRFPDNSVVEAERLLNIPNAKLSDAGVYTLELIREDEVVMIGQISVTIYPKYEVDTTITLQEGDYYSFGSKLLNAPGLYTARLQSENGCDSVVNLTISIDSVQVNVSTENNGPVCEGENLVLSAHNIPSNAKLLWTGPNDFHSQDSVVTIKRVSTLDSGEYHLEVILNTRKVRAPSTFVDIFASDKVEVFENMTSNEFIYNDQVFTRPGEYIFHLKNEHGCDSVVTLNLQLMWDFVDIIPEPYFSPNGDGVRDRWFIQGADDTPTTVKIFDRFGKFLISFDTYSNENGWDGKDTNGYDLPSADYWYSIVNIKSEKYYVGHVTLIR